jgi:hypothetical protein
VTVDPVEREFFAKFLDMAVVRLDVDRPNSPSSLAFVTLTARQPGRRW